MSARRFGRTKAVAGLAAAAALVPPWLLIDPRSAGAKALEQRFHRWIAAGFGLRPVVSGRPAGAGTLLVANHVSWADIVALASVVDTDFVAKADVADYPGLGLLARRTGTIFIDRTRRAAAAAQTDAIRTRLAAGRRVLVFPEGTTSDGAGVLPFRSSLFAAADSARHVQPVSLFYTARDGAPPDAVIRDAVAWLGEQTMADNAALLARVRAGIAICFHEPVAPGNFADRKALAEFCRSAIVRSHAAFQAASPKRDP
jgi:1-acyl-sn-glycerol-3-phosphate acyltransferase